MMKLTWQGTACLRQEHWNSWQQRFQHWHEDWTQMRWPMRQRLLAKQFSSWPTYCRRGSTLWYCRETAASTCHCHELTPVESVLVSPLPPPRTSFKTVMITFTPDTCLKLFSDSHKFGSKLVCLVQPYANFFQILITIYWKCFRRAFQRYKEHLSHTSSSYTFT